MSGKRFLVILGLVCIVLISLPYLIGFQAGNSSNSFGGFLMNPLDGHSYLAKMQQGYRGDWKFKLPYTSEPGEGAYLFLFYLILGKIGRLTQIPLIFVFHGARVLSAAWLIYLIYQLIQAVFEDTNAIKAGLVLAVFGSGMGWLAVLAGAFTSDFWVAEAYPFLAMYTNPHFSLGLGIMIWSLLPNNRDDLISNLLSGLLLGIIQPFAVVILSLIKIIRGGLRILQEKIGLKAQVRSGWFWANIGFCLTGGLVIMYQFWAIQTDPILSLWHQQNITAKPLALDLVVSLSPCLILALVGARRAWSNETGKILLLWGLVSLVLVFIPWNLQRRFLTGIYLPLAIISIFGLQVLRDKTSLKFRHWYAAVLFLALPTNLVVIASGAQAITKLDSSIYLDKGLIEGMQWIDINADLDAVVLADQQDGLYVPSYTGRRVIYGHPFETIFAAEQIALVAELYGGEKDGAFIQEVLDSRNVDYVIFNVNGQNGFGDWLSEHWELQFQSRDVNIFARQDE
jgi:hypothetical protein